MFLFRRNANKICYKYKSRLKVLEKKKKLIKILFILEKKNIWFYRSLPS